MRRPMAVIGAVFVLALAVFCTVGAESLKIAVLIAAVGLFVSVFARKGENKIYIAVCALAVLAAATAFYAEYNYSYLPASRLGGKDISVQAAVASQPRRSRGGYFYYTVKTESINGEARREKITVYQRYEPSLETDDEITAEIKLFPAEAGFSSYGVFLSGWLGEITSHEKSERHGANYYFEKIREYLTDNIKSALPSEEGEVLCALLLGIKEGVSREVLEDFSIAGVSHLFAVSGLHLTTWVGLISFLEWKSARTRKIALCFSCLFVLFFMALTGFAPSVVRAGIMSLIAFGGRFLSRRADGLNSLGLAAIVICMRNPFAAVDIGFLLSFSATAGILICEKPAMKRIRATRLFSRMGRFAPIADAFLGSIVVTVSASLFSLPVTLMVYGYISFVNVAANLLVSGAAATAMVCAGLGGAIPPLRFLDFLIKPIFLFGGLCAKYCMLVCSALASLPLAGINISLGLAGIFLAVAFVSAGACILFSKRALYRPNAAAVSVFLALAIAFSAFAADNSKLKITVCDCGNNSAVLLSAGGAGVLFAEGDEKDILYPLKSAERARGKPEIPCALTSDSDFAENLLKKTDTGKIYISGAVGPENKENLKMIPVGSSGTLVLSEKVRAQFSAGDDYSFVLITYNEATVLISLTPVASLESAPREWLNADILICSEKLPKDYEKFGFSYIILSCERAALDNGEIIPSDEVYLTAGAGNICIAADKNGNFIIRRDS